MSGWRSASQQASVPPIERPDHDHPVAAGGEVLVGGLGGTGPVLPPGREHVLDRGAVPGQQRAARR